jgi:hypothetical protein
LKRICASAVRSPSRKVTLRYDSRLHHIGLGRRHRGKAILLFVAARDYQRQSA